MQLLTVVGRSVLAFYSCPVLIEVCAFWLTGHSLGPAMVGRYLMVVALVVGVAIGLLASAGHAESVAARCWLAIPPFIVLIPLLVRQLGAWAVLVTVVFMLLWVLRGPSRSPASVTVAAGAGSILAVQVALFFIRYYRGRQTDLMPLFLVTATAVLSVVIYLGSSDPKYW